VRQNNGGALGFLDHFRHGEGFTRTRDTKQHLITLVLLQALDQLCNGTWLVTAWGEIRSDL
jgi:hypothetical protein